jgi:hypothetical protein
MYIYCRKPIVIRLIFNYLRLKGEATWRRSRRGKTSTLSSSSALLSMEPTFFWMCLSAGCEFLPSSVHGSFPRAHGGASFALDMNPDP